MSEETRIHNGVSYTKDHNNTITKDGKNFYIYYNLDEYKFLLVDEDDNIIEDSTKYKDAFLARLKMGLGYVIESK